MDIEPLSIPPEHHTGTESALALRWDKLHQWCHVGANDLHKQRQKRTVNYKDISLEVCFILDEASFNWLQALLF